MLSRTINGNVSSLKLNKFIRYNSSTSTHGSNLMRLGKFPARRNWGVNFLRSGSKYIIERFGKFNRVENPGLSYLIPFVDKIAYVVDERELCLRIAPETAMTDDNVAVTLGGNLYIQFFDAEKAVYGASHAIYAVSQFAQAVMRTSVGGYKLDKLFSERTHLNSKVRAELEEGAQKWGCRVIRFEITDLDALDKNVSQALHKQSSAERSSREKIIAAEASKKETELVADGYKYQQIAQAKGDAEKVKLDADANAYKITAQAEAERKSLDLIAEALNKPGGKETMMAKLSEKYFDALKHLGQNSTIIVPQNLGDISSMIAAGHAVFKESNKTPFDQNIKETLTNLQPQTHPKIST